MDKMRLVVRLPGRCPNCSGTYILDDGVNKCVSCARTVETLKAKSRYYDANQEAILDDVKNLGRARARSRWKIPKGSFARLVLRWSKDGAPAPAPAPAADGKLFVPALPAFDSSWSERIQEKWLEIWLYLKIQEGKGDQEEGK